MQASSASPNKKFSHCELFYSKTWVFFDGVRFLVSALRKIVIGFWMLTFEHMGVAAGKPP